MKKYTTVIFLGPGLDLAYLVNNESPKFILTMLNESILSINLRWVNPVSIKTIVVVIKEHLEELKKILKKYKEFKEFNIEIEPVEEYEGVFSVLKRLKPRLSDNIITFKGDIISDSQINTFTDNFINDQSMFETFFYESSDKNKLIGVRGNKLLFYEKLNKEDVNIKNKVFFKHQDIEMTLSYELLQFYLLKKQILDDTYEGRHMSLEIIPQIIDKYSESGLSVWNKVNKTNVKQVKTPECFFSLNMRLLKDKNRLRWLWLSDSDAYKNIFLNLNTNDKHRNTLFGKYFECNDESFVRSCIIGDNVSIGKKCKIINSIVMNNVKIKDNVTIEDSFVGNEVVIPINSVLKKCQISSKYIFRETIMIDQKIFILIK